MPGFKSPILFQSYAPFLTLTVVFLESCLQTINHHSERMRQASFNNGLRLPCLLRGPAGVRRLHTRTVGPIGTLPRCSPKIASRSGHATPQTRDAPKVVLRRTPHSVPPTWARVAEARDGANCLAFP